MKTCINCKERDGPCGKVIAAHKEHAVQYLKVPDERCKIKKDGGPKKSRLRHTLMSYFYALLST